MRKIGLSVFLLVFVAGLKGQDSFLFRNTLADTAKVKIDYSFARDHYMGHTIARKMYLVKETYTYIEKGTPLSPGDKTIVGKPAIYYSIRKLSSYYKKAIKKDWITESEALDRFGRILDISYVIYGQETDEFEDYLKDLKEPEDIEKAFSLIVLQ